MYPDIRMDDWGTLIRTILIRDQGDRWKLSGTFLMKPLMSSGSGVEIDSEGV